MPYIPTWILRFVESEMFFNTTTFVILLLGAATMLTGGFISRVLALTFCLVCVFLFYGMGHIHHGFAVALALITTSVICATLGFYRHDNWFWLSIMAVAGCIAYKLMTGDPPWWTLGFTAFMLVVFMVIGWHIIRPTPTTAHERTMSDLPYSGETLTNLRQAAAQARARHSR